MNNEVVITGLGLVSGAGVGPDAQMSALQGKTTANRSLADFRAAAHLSDKRMMKAISHADAIGLAAVELLKKDASWETLATAPEKIGMYVGAPPAGASDNAYYMDAQKAAGGSLKAFGAACMNAKPTTLLIGLPNNVLCYGAMVLDARGPNNNYTSSAPSGLVAVMSAARRVERGQIEVGVAGGFCAYHADPVNKGVLVAGGLDDGAIADGAAFVALERRSGATARGANVHAAIAGMAQASDAMGPWAFDPTGAGLESAVRRAMEQAGMAASDIGLLLTSGIGVQSADDRELSVLTRVFAEERGSPALGTFVRALGHLMEAGGVMELALAAQVAAGGEVPALMRVRDDAVAIDPRKKGILVLRTSLSGDYACVVLRRES